MLTSPTMFCTKKNKFCYSTKQNTLQVVLESNLEEHERDVVLWDPLNLHPLAHGVALAKDTVVHPHHVVAVVHHVVTVVHHHVVAVVHHHVVPVHHVAVGHLPVKHLPVKHPPVHGHAVPGQGPLHLHHVVIHQGGVHVRRGHHPHGWLSLTLEPLVLALSDDPESLVVSDVLDALVEAVAVHVHVVALDTALGVAHLVLLRVAVGVPVSVVAKVIPLVVLVDAKLLLLLVIVVHLTVHAHHVVGSHVGGHVTVHAVHAAVQAHVVHVTVHGHLVHAHPLVLLVHVGVLVLLLLPAHHLTVRHHVTSGHVHVVGHHVTSKHVHVVGHLPVVVGHGPEPILLVTAESQLGGSGG